MLCSISGEAPQHPVASSKSGIVYEKRLIEAYISENHKDPVNGEDLDISDLIDLKSSRIVAPRPPTLTSIPSLLSTFQNEWDALALESFTIRQQLHQTRQELATALYQHDAAVRVIARLTAERNEARDALSKVTINAGGASNDDAMQVDSQGLPEELAAKVDETKAKLSKTRPKRPVPKEWATSEAIEKFGVASASKALYPGSVSLALNDSAELVIFGGSDGVAGVYSIPENKLQKSFKAGAAITDSAWYGDLPIVSTVSGSVKVSDQTTFTSHAGSANALALHPSGEILASVGVDKSFVFYDLPNGKAVNQVYTDSELTTAAFHPDGHLFAAGGVDGQIKLFHVKTGENAANFDLGGPVQDLTFSENGIWFAAVARDSTSVVIFDLRKEGKAAQVKTLEIGGQVESIRWDYTGQFLAASGPGGLTISQYTKSTKSWTDVISLAVPATAVQWGPQASSLVTVNGDGVITVLGSISVGLNQRPERRLVQRQLNLGPSLATTLEILNYLRTESSPLGTNFIERTESASRVSVEVKVMDLWPSEPQRQKRSYNEMSQPATLSPSPLHNFFNLGGFSRFTGPGPSNSASPPAERRRISHPHNPPQHSRGPSEDMAEQPQLQHRPSLQHRASQTLIDLTEDIEESQPVPRNRAQPRSRSQRPPQLGRSDAVIDLTEDSDLVITSTRRIPTPPNSRNPGLRDPTRHRGRHPSPQRFFTPDAPEREVNGGLGIGGFANLGAHRFGVAAGRATAFLEMAVQQMRGMGGMDHFEQFHNGQAMPGMMNYERVAFADRKPDHVPPPQAREGFTRSPTEKDTVVCPSCDEELIHMKDVEEPVVKKAGKAPTRKEREEHPFWVVKECGHVYCNRCYQNRVSSKHQPPEVYFPERTVGKTSKRAPYCTVEDCESEVKNKEKWVGVFL